MGNAQWREVDTTWHDQSPKTLKDEITALCKDREKKCPLKIVLMGPVGAGKSSFINTIDSVYTGYVTCQAWSALPSEAESTTSKPKAYQPAGRSGEYENFVLCDTQGIEQEYKITEQDLRNCIDGNITYGYKFNSLSQLQIEPPSMTDDKSHCVCLVFDATKYKHLPKEVLSTCHNIIKELKEKETPCIVLLTKIDMISKSIADDLKNVFRSKSLKKVLDSIEQEFGINPRQILPVKNYHEEQELSTKVNILACHTLRQMLRAANDSFRAFQNNE